MKWEKFNNVKTQSGEQKMKKRLLVYVLSAAMVMGAGTLGSVQAEETGDVSGEIALLMTNDWVDENTDLGKEFTRVIHQYEEEHPGTKITLQGASQQDIKESFQTAALAGGGADVVIMDNSGHAIDLAAMGLLYPLSNLTTAEELTEQYQEGPLNSGKFQGEYYSVPWYMDCCGLFYNADRLEELNLSVPTTWANSQLRWMLCLKQDTAGLSLIRARTHSIPSFIRMSARLLTPLEKSLRW